MKGSHEMPMALMSLGSGDEGSSGVWDSCYVGGCQNYDPLLGPLNTRCRIIIRRQKGTIILATTHVAFTRSGACKYDGT